MLRRILRKSTASLFLVLSACGLTSRCGAPDPVDEATFNALYASPNDIPDAPLNVYHLGHSLVGPYMPVMLQQLRAQAMTITVNWDGGLHCSSTGSRTFRSMALRNPMARPPIATRKRRWHQGSMMWLF